MTSGSHKGVPYDGYCVQGKRERGEEAISQIEKLRWNVGERERERELLLQEGRTGKKIRLVAKEKESEPRWNGMGVRKDDEASRLQFTQAYVNQHIGALSSQQWHLHDFWVIWDSSMHFSFRASLERDGRKHYFSYWTIIPRGFVRIGDNHP